MQQSLIPRQPVPNLIIPLIGGGQWNLAEANCRQFFMLVFYRGYHCPICKPYLQELQNLSTEYNKRGITTLVLSSDTQERAQLTKDEWQLHDLELGYGLSIEEGRKWGLFVSTSRGKTSSGVMEPDKFTEPGLFLIRPNRTLYAALIQTMPFARSHFSDLLKAIDFIIAKDYPARGEA